MNHWAQMLTDLPTCLQRVIARTQRISLPRSCDAAMRTMRLRRALCHAATVRATYAALDAETQAALQALRAQRGSLQLADIYRTYGTVRSWRQITADPKPRTITERLILLGWLLPRPATPRHPVHYMLPPELRRWLPHPLQITCLGSAPPAPPAPALRAVATLVCACAIAPVPVRADGTLRCSALRCLAQRLVPWSLEDTRAIYDVLLPICADLGLIARHHHTYGCTVAGQCFLALAPAEQLARLRRAWIAMSTPDRSLRSLLPQQHGIDWPLLRRRLCAWVEHLPVGSLVDPATLYPSLATALGPLADAQTHGFRYVDRVPWQPRRAAAIFTAALRGPLHWLGFIAWYHDEQSLVPRCARMSNTTSVRATVPDWRYGKLGEVIIPHTAVDDAVMDLLPFSRWQAANEKTTTYVITRTTIAQAVSRGHSDTRLWAVLELAAGPPPPNWRSDIAVPPMHVSMSHKVVVQAQPPAVFDQALQARSVRRYLDTAIAPGVGLTQLEHATSLARALQRHGIASSIERAPSAPPPAELSPAECAALLVACAFYRQHAPSTAPLLPDDTLEARLRAALPAALRSAVTMALADLAAHTTHHHAPSNGHGHDDDPITEPTSPHSAALSAAVLRLLQRALTNQLAVELTYYTATRAAWSQRIVQPLALEQRHGDWYLRAYCTTRQTERTFRVDRIADIRVVHRRPLPRAAPADRHLLGRAD